MPKSKSFKCRSCKRTSNHRVHKGEDICMSCNTKIRGIIYKASVGEQRAKELLSKCRAIDEVVNTDEEPGYEVADEFDMDAAREVLFKYLIELYCYRPYDAGESDVVRYERKKFKRSVNMLFDYIGFGGKKHANFEEVGIKYGMTQYAVKLRIRNVFSRFGFALGVSISTGRRYTHNNLNLSREVVDEELYDKLLVDYEEKKMTNKLDRIKSKARG